MTKQVSFVVPLFNHLAESQVMLYSLLESLPAGLDYEVILVDDYSTDGTRDWLAELSLAQVRFAVNVHNSRYAFTTNHGAGLATGEYLCLLNNDLVFEPGWLEPMLGALRSPTLKLGLVGNVQYRVADGSLDHTGVRLSDAGHFVHMQPQLVPDSGLQKVLAVTGACMLMRRAVYEQVGGLDERYLNGCEDIDLCYKVRQLGLGVAVSYESRIKHHVSLSRGQVSLQNERNSQMLFAKWRKEIKQDLAAVWLPKLQNGSGWDASALPGLLSDDFLASPFTASRIITESVLCRLEAYWARTLDDAPLTPVEKIRVSTHGVERVTGTPYYKICDAVVIDAVGLRSARNVYVCGFKVAADEPREIAVSFEVNSIQTVVQRFASEQDMNVGVINPLWLSGAPNRIKVSFAFVGNDGVALGNACGAVCLTHVVVDDQEFRDLG